MSTCAIFDNNTRLDTVFGAPTGRGTRNPAEGLGAVNGPRDLLLRPFHGNNPSLEAVRAAALEGLGEDLEVCDWELACGSKDELGSIAKVMADELGASPEEISGLTRAFAALVKRSGGRMVTIEEINAPISFAGETTTAWDFAYEVVSEVAPGLLERSAEGDEAVDAEDFGHLAAALVLAASGRYDQVIWVTRDTRANVACNVLGTRVPGLVAMRPSEFTNPVRRASVLATARRRSA